jgi:hypothetical protein
VAPKPSSQYRGVHWNRNLKTGGGWAAEIQVGGSGNQYLGRFATELEAARTYDAAAHAQGVGGRANFAAAPTAPIQ